MQSENISAPTHVVSVERNIPIPMKDGTILRADIYRPQSEGRYPVIVERVAYELTKRCQFHGEYYTSRGYVFVGQNVRGRYASEGQFNPFRDDAWGANRDGYDTIKWAGEQPWSSGAVGMIDGSYSGFTQYMLAPTRPPYLKALFVREGGADAYRDFLFRNGAYQLALDRSWSIEQILAPLQQKTLSPEEEALRIRLEKALENIDHWYRYLPLKSCPPLEGIADWFFEGLNHPEDGPYWAITNLVHKFSEVDVPIMHLSGWFDCFLDGTLRAFSGIRAYGKTEKCRANQRLIVGPWIHGPSRTSERKAGDLDFGPNAEFDLETYRLRWYDHWLKGIENGIMNDPPIRIFLMGANRWLNLETWPPTTITYQPIYFHQGTGTSTASLNNGTLSFESPSANELSDSFQYDPENPIPSLITYPQLGPTDHRSVEARMLTYTSHPLEKDLAVVGPIKAILYATSSAPDTDWVVRLCDVWPDGRSISVCDGILRARYRNSLAQSELMNPGEVYHFEIDLWSTAQVFQAGHRIRVEVTSSDFPRYDRNLNTGGPFGEEVQGQVALNTIFHDAERASHILLPIRL